MGARTVRGRPHRRYRARDSPRCYRLSDEPRRACRPRGAFRAPRDDVERCPRHLLCGAAERGGRHPVGRSRPVAHGAEAPRLGAHIHAEPTTFGLKLAGHYAEFARNRARLAAARKEVATCTISGAVDTFAHIDPRVEAHVAEKLGLEPEPISTQVIPRDRHAQFFMTLALIAAGVERLATEIRHLQRTEVREAEEYFAPGQKGSSAMKYSS